ncbi:mediator of RNA polymerase II transcription subunit 15a-like isoform X2 [Carex rostrata]
MEGGFASGSGSGAGADPNAHPDWRSELSEEGRQRIVNKIMETLKRHLPVPVPEGLIELQKIASRFEEKIYNSAFSQKFYFFLEFLEKKQNTSKRMQCRKSFSI